MLSSLDDGGAGSQGWALSQDHPRDGSDHIIAADGGDGGGEGGGRCHRRTMGWWMAIGSSDDLAYDEDNCPR